MVKHVDFKRKEIIIPGATVITLDAESALGFAPIEVYAQAKAKIKKDFIDNERAIKSLTNGINFETLKGSQFFWNNYLNNFLKEQGINGRIMNINDLGNIYALDKNFFENHYSDTINLCLRSEEIGWKNNKHILEDLVKQVKSREKSFSPKNPLIISNLEIVSDNNSNNFYGLLLKLKEDSILENDERFAFGKNKIKFESLFGDVEKNLYTKEKDLSRVYANDSQNVNGDNDVLHDSNDNGWVVFVSDEVANSSQNFKEHLKSLKEERDKQITEINQRYIQALDILKGKK
ncbi:MAG: hypothetical protein WC812_04200 [Candidatus Pacearchaeota archaeon]|jgi:hypothetical protein